MNLIGDDIGADDTEVDEQAPSPWETIEPEEIDRELPVAQAQPVAPAVAEAPLRVAVKLQGAPTFSEGAASGFDRDSRESDGDESFDGPTRGGGWTIPLLCIGIGLIACCLIIPQADSNRRMAYQKVLLQRDLESIQKQVTVNDEFLKRVNDDSGLAERLAQRQMNIVREGNRVWIDGQSSATLPVMSPYELTTVPKPAPLPPYQPTGGWFAALCRDPRSNLYLTGSALMMLAAGLVMGMAPRTE